MLFNERNCLMDQTNRKTALKRVVSLLLAVLLLVGVAFSCTSCIVLLPNTPPSESPDDTPKEPAELLSKDEIKEKMDSFNANTVYEYVSDYLIAFGVPSFKTDRFKWVEYTTVSYYVEALPDAYTMARRTCESFLENKYDKTDLNDEEAVTKELIASYISSIGDRYAVYRSADEYEEYNTDMSGSFVGIGVSVEYNYTENTILVTGVYRDSGAELAGIKAGDYIHAVDGVTLEEAGYDATVNSIRGELDTKVTITVIRNGKFLDLVATRKLVIEKSVEYRIDEGDIGYIAISSFKANTFSQFKEAVDHMTSNNVKGIVFDVRNNPGGYLNSVMDTLSYLVSMGTPIVSYQYRGEDKRGFTSMDPHSISIPCTVICNEYTASAGELFTAALRDYNDMGKLNVTVVGTTTYGKGIMQSTYMHNDKSSLTLTVAYYYPPSGVNYHNVGVIPDVEVKPTTPDVDEQYVKAVEELQKLIAAGAQSAE